MSLRSSSATSLPKLPLASPTRVSGSTRTLNLFGDEGCCPPCAATAAVPAAVSNSDVAKMRRQVSSLCSISKISDLAVDPAREPGEGTRAKVLNQIATKSSSRAAISSLVRPAPLCVPTITEPAPVICPASMPQPNRSLLGTTLRVKNQSEQSLRGSQIVNQRQQGPQD